MNWDDIKIGAEELQIKREAAAKAEAYARMKRAELMAEDLLLQLGTLLTDAIKAEKAAVSIIMDTPDEVDFDTFMACSLSQCPEGFRLKINRRGAYTDVFMWALACPPANITDYLSYDFRDDSYF